MLATKFYKNYFQKSLRYFNSFTRTKTIKSLSNNVSCTRTKLLRNLSPILSQCRNSSGETQNEITLPTLTDDEKLFLPNIFRSISNFVKLHLVIKNKLDKDFKLQDFLEGSKQAVETVSYALAKEDYESISDLVDAETLEKLRHKINSLTPEQKALIGVKKEWVLACFPYDVEITTRDADRKFVEITVVYHAMSSSAGGIDLNYNSYEEFHKKNLMFVCNYRFIREFSRDLDTPWIINRINHFVPSADRNK